MSELFCLGDIYLKKSLIDRLENEHLGNVDQYRVTREVPLPYSFDDAANDSDVDDDDKKSISSWRSRRRAAKAQTLRDAYKVGPNTPS